LAWIMQAALKLTKKYFNWQTQVTNA